MDEALLLCPTDVVYCHDHRGMDWPSEEWFHDALRKRPSLIHEALVNEAMRQPGNKVLWHDHFEEMDFEFVDDTQALRWDAKNHPARGLPDAEVRWNHARSKFDIRDLLKWCRAVNELDRFAEMLIVDDDLDVVSYRVKEVHPKGRFETHFFERSGAIDMLNGSSWVSGKGGAEGIPSFLGGCVLDENSSPEENDKVSAKVARDMENRGLLVRTGFKYGVRWRAYEGNMSENHAPWLVSHPRSLPVDWTSACQGSRLSSGVNKTMLLPVVDGDSVSYVAIVRPPPDARWSTTRRRQ
tara:strand:+ start:608 stop:1495 length:888 start_codon:yes stop_codon:yes gene_type:complete